MTEYWLIYHLGKYIISSPLLMMSRLYVYSFMHHVLGREQGQTITIGCRNDWRKKNDWGQGYSIQRAISFNQGLYCIFCKKESEVAKKKDRKKEKSPQDLTRLCRGAKGHLMNNVWRRNENQFLSKLSQTPPPAALGPWPFFSSNHMCYMFLFYLCFI